MGQKWPLDSPPFPTPLRGGLLVDRKESGAPGDFAAMQAADEVMAVIKRELGDQAAALAAALAKPDDGGDQVTVIELDDTRDEGSTLN